MASREPIKVTCGARVTVTVEIGNVGAWGADCGMDQVFKQAAEAAVGRLRKSLGPTDWRIVGEPKVQAVMSDYNDRPGRAAL